MSLRSIFRDSLGSISRRGFGPWRKDGGNHDRGRSASSLDLALHGAWDDDGCDGGPRSWAGMPPELLREVVRRLEQGEGGAWPDRRHLVAFASVCRSWRQLCKEIAGVPEATGKITFPVALKQPGFRSGPIQCYIKRNKSASTYHLYLGLNTESGKFLLAARKIRRPTHAEYIISMSAKDISSNSVSYMGKIRSNFLGTKFAIYDSQPPYRGAVASTGRSSRRFYSKKVSPKLPSGNYGIAHVAYELNMLGTRGPRRMRCAMYSIPASALEPNGSVPSYDDISPDLLEESFSSIGPPHSLDRVIGDSKLSESSRFSSSFRFASSSRFTNSARFASSSRFTNSSRFASSSRFTEVSVDIGGKGIPLILKNKPPRWHEQLQCWCLNFRGRVTVASVKNFQLIASSGETTNDTNTAAAAGASQTGSTGAGASQTGSTGASTSQTGSTDRDKIILQFGKIGKDLFTMDFRYPLSAFQAFAICLSSFDSKLACE